MNTFYCTWNCGNVCQQQCDYYGMCYNVVCSNCIKMCNRCVKQRAMPVCPLHTQDVNVFQIYCDDCQKGMFVCCRCNVWKFDQDGFKELGKCTDEHDSESICNECIIVEEMQFISIYKYASTLL